MKKRRAKKSIPEKRLLGGEIQLYDIEHIAKEFGVCLETVRRYIRKGRLRGQKIGPRYYVSRDALRDFANGRP